MVDEATVAERVDDVLTIYQSAITGNPIGFQIKGVYALARRYGWEGILVESTEDGEELQTVSISALLLAAYEGGPKTIARRRAYAGVLDAPGARGARMQVPKMRVPGLVPCGERAGAVIDTVSFGGTPLLRDKNSSVDIHELVIEMKISRDSSRATGLLRTDARSNSGFSEKGCQKYPGRKYKPHPPGLRRAGVFSSF